MAITVRCSNCSAVYETEATAAAVVEVARCQACGERTLTLEHDDEPGDDALAD